jgi:hypothetical protein
MIRKRNSTSLSAENLKRFAKKLKTSTDKSANVVVEDVLNKEPNRILWTQKDFNNDDTEVPVIDAKSSLEAFVQPLNIQDFKNFFFRKRAFANTNGSRDRVRGMVQKYLSNLDLETILEESASVDSENGGNDAGIFVWTRDGSTGKIQSISVEPKAAAICFNAQGSGAALYFRSPQKMANEVAKGFAMALGMDFTSLYSNGDVKPEIEMFVSHKGHYTDWHTDFQENFTIQLKGSKKWKVAKGAVINPLRGCTPHYFDNEAVKETQMKAHCSCSAESEIKLPKEWEEVVLGEGDVLYHPAGLWHAVETLEESVSMNISLIGTSWADMLSDGVRQLLWREERTRGVITFDQASNGKIDIDAARNQAALALDRLKEIVNKMTPEDLLPGAIFKLSTSVVPVIDGTTRLRWNQLCSMFKSTDMSCLTKSNAEDEDEDEENEESYIVHFAYGNDNMESQARWALPIQSQDDAFIYEKVQTLSSVETTSSAQEIAENLKLSLDKVIEVLFRLLKLGALIVVA